MRGDQLAGSYHPLAVLSRYRVKGQYTGGPSKLGMATDAAIDLKKAFADITGVPIYFYRDLQQLLGSFRS